jgi:hypothetical protein
MALNGQNISHKPQKTHCFGSISMLTLIVEVKKTSLTVKTEKVVGLVFFLCYSFFFTSGYHPPTGGFGFGGGGLGIPTRKCSPVVFRFHLGCLCVGQFIFIAPFRLFGQAWTQQPHSQHSSGYMSMGGLDLSGLGSKMSILQALTHKGSRNVG